MTPRRLYLTGAACALSAAILWAAVAVQQMSAHGRTSVNEMRLVWGLTWMDTAKALPFAVALLLPGLECLVRRARATGAAKAALTGRVVQALVVFSAVTGAIDFWSFPTGSYAVTFEERGETVPWQFLAMLLAAVLLLALAVIRRRAGGGEWAVLTLLGVGMVAGSLWTPALMWPVLAWLGFAAWLAAQARVTR